METLETRLVKSPKTAYSLTPSLDAAHSSHRLHFASTSLPATREPHTIMVIFRMITSTSSTTSGGITDHSGTTGPTSSSKTTGPPACLRFLHPALQAAQNTAKRQYTHSSCHRRARLFQPCTFLFIEIRAQFPKHSRMITVQPFQLFPGHSSSFRGRVSMGQ